MSIQSVMSSIYRSSKWLYNEFGIASVYHTGKDAWFIILCRSCRMFSYGAAALVIALFFASLEFSDYQIGLFMTLTLVGDVLLSLLITLVADRVGRRRVILMGACLMMISGAIFSYFENFWILLFAAVVGVISATGSDFGPFRAIEESMISELTTPKTRADVLSWYVATSIFGSAAGTEFSGRAIEYMRQRDGWSVTDAYHAIFWLYILMGIVNVVLVFSMSKKCELPEKAPTTEESELLLDAQQSDELGEDRNASRNADEHASAAPKQPVPHTQGRIAQISVETRGTLYKLWFLLTVDSLADGMASFSLTNYYLDRKFQLPKSFLGDVASISYLLAFVSTVLGSPLARYLGLIRTMVFTHLPSSIAVLLFPFPQGITLTVILFFIRTGLNNMDQAPRAAFIAAVVKPEERTAVNGITSTFRTLAATIGPSVTGFLAGNDQFWIAFVVAGALRIAYDLGLFLMFVNVELHSQERDDRMPNNRRSSDEEEMRELQPVTRTSSATGNLQR